MPSGQEYPQLSSSSIWARAWKLLLSMTINKYNWRVWSTGILGTYLFKQVGPLPASFLPEADHRKLFIGDNKLSCLIKSETVTATHNQHHQPAVPIPMSLLHSQRRFDGPGLSYKLLRCYRKLSILLLLNCWSKESEGLVIWRLQRKKKWETFLYVHVQDDNLFKNCM